MPRGPMTIEQFWAKVQKTDGCWLWTGGVNRIGYGKLQFRNKDCLAHRLAYELIVGPIPVGMGLRHDCDCKACVRPDHLIVGTQADSMAHMAMRRRSAVGERNPHAKLTEAMVLEIRNLCASGARKTDLAKRYNVTCTTIRLIEARQIWRHIDAASTG